MQASAWAGSTVIGSGGTFATLASIVLARRGSADGAVHGIVVQDKELEQMLMTLAGLSAEQRRQTRGLRPERADIIVAGLAVVAELLRIVESAEVTVSGFGLRDGLLLEMAGLE
ncbi:MAG: Ppx/GppA phosphatase family protein, partial [Gemmatimonadales bacterium]